MDVLGEPGSRSEFVLCVGTWLLIVCYLVGIWTLAAFGFLLLSHKV